MAAACERPQEAKGPYKALKGLLEPLRGPFRALIITEKRACQSPFKIKAFSKTKALAAACERPREAKAAAAAAAKIRPLYGK